MSYATLLVYINADRVSGRLRDSPAKVLGRSPRLVLEGMNADGGSSGSQSIVPYLPLSELTPRRPPVPATTGQQQGGGTR